MVARLDRNQPILDPIAPRVDDGKTQRALDSLQVALRAVIKFLIPFIQPEKWKPLPFADATVSNYGSGYQVCQYRKDPMGRVHVRGELTHSGAHPANEPLAQLPIGYRPPAALNFGVGDGGAGSGLVEVTATGEINHIAGATAQISLNFSFDTSEV